MEGEESKDKDIQEINYHWPALESDPQIFTEYLLKLGMSDEWHLCEVFGLDDDWLSFVPQPCLGAIVAFDRKTREDEKPGLGENSEIVPFYMKQTGTLDNACGIIACLHAIMNHLGEISLFDESILDRFAKNTNIMTPAERAKYLEEFKEFKEEHKHHSSKGQTEVPTSSK